MRLEPIADAMAAGAPARAKCRWRPPFAVGGDSSSRQITLSYPPPACSRDVLASCRATDDAMTLTPDEAVAELAPRRRRRATAITACARQIARSRAYQRQPGRPTTSGPPETEIRERRRMIRRRPVASRAQTSARSCSHEALDVRQLVTVAEITTADSPPEVAIDDDAVGSSPSVVNRDVIPPSPSRRSPRTPACSTPPRCRVCAAVTPLAAEWLPVGLTYGAPSMTRRGGPDGCSRGGRLAGRKCRRRRPPFDGGDTSPLVARGGGWVPCSAMSGYLPGEPTEGVGGDRRGFAGLPVTSRTSGQLPAAASATAVRSASSRTS